MRSEPFKSWVRSYQACADKPPRASQLASCKGSLPLHTLAQPPLWSHLLLTSWATCWAPAAGASLHPLSTLSRLQPHRPLHMLFLLLGCWDAWSPTSHGWLLHTLPALSEKASLTPPSKQVSPPATLSFPLASPVHYGFIWLLSLSPTGLSVHCFIPGPPTVPGT